MPKSKLTIQEKLTKFKSLRYDNDSKRLLEAGFTATDAEKMILRPSSRKTVKYVLEKYQELLKEPYDLSHKQIVSMASHKGSEQAIRTVVESFEKLKELEFSKEQIVAIASKEGGSKAIKTVLEFFEKLKKLEFSKEQIVFMASNKGGSQAIKTVLELFEKLKKLKLSQEQIVVMASNNCGATVIRTVLDCFEKLKELGFSKELIVVIASKEGATRTINALLKNYKELSDHGYSRQDITKLATIHRGYLKIEKIIADKLEDFFKCLSPMLVDSGEVSPQTSPASFDGVYDKQTNEPTINPHSNSSLHGVISETSKLVNPNLLKAHDSNQECTSSKVRDGDEVNVTFLSTNSRTARYAFGFFAKEPNGGKRGREQMIDVSTKDPKDTPPRKSSKTTSKPTLHDLTVLNHGF